MGRDLARDDGAGGEDDAFTNGSWSDSDSDSELDSDSDSEGSGRSPSS